MEHKVIAVDGMNVHYVQAGSGPVVLMVHGVGASQVAWRRNIAPLADAGFTAIALDLPGHGDSDKPKNIEYDPIAAVHFLAHFLDALKVDRASMMGNSGGGLVAASFALEYPDRTDRLILVAPGGLAQDVSLFLRLLSVPVVGEIIYNPWMHNTVGMSKQLFYSPPSFPRDVLEELDRVQSMPGATRAALRSIRSSINYRGMMDRRLVIDRLGSLTAPLLTVWGENDQLIPVSHVQAVRQVVPHGLVRTFPECGHWPQMEKAAEFNPLIIEFLEGSLDKQAGQPSS